MRLRYTRGLMLSLLLAVCCPGSTGQTQGREQAVEIPFDLYRNEIILAVKVNGKGPYSMLLDTGTDPSAIDLALSREIGLKLDPAGQGGRGGGAGVNLAYETALPLLEVGGLTAKNVEAVAIDLSKIGARLGRPLHGILGHSLLNGRVMQIDYPRHLVRFFAKSALSKAASEPNTPRRTLLRFRYADNILLDEVSVNGRKVVANLDTGSDGAFKLTPAAVSSLGLEREVGKAQAASSVGYNGVSENREGTITDVTIGGIRVDAPRATFLARGAGWDKKPWGITIGNAFLKDFVLTIDYRNRLVLLERP